MVDFNEIEISEYIKFAFKRKIHMCTFNFDKDRLCFEFYLNVKMNFLMN